MHSASISKIRLGFLIEWLLITLDSARGHPNARGPCSKAPSKLRVCTVRSPPSKRPAILADDNRDDRRTLAEGSLSEGSTAPKETHLSAKGARPAR